MSNSQKIFIIDPIGSLKTSYHAKIVYADSETGARRAASNTLQNGQEDIYLEEGMSLCYQPDIDILEDKGTTLKIEFRDVIYELSKDHAQDVISESIF